MIRLVCGLQPVREAVAARAQDLERVLVDARDSPQLEALARFARDRGAKVDRVSRAELDRLAHGVHHQGAIAFAPPLRVLALADVELGEDALVVVLDAIEDPQNFGAIVRSAVAMGATCVVWPEHHAAPLSPATFRASAGAIEHAQLCRVGSLTAAIEALRARGLYAVALDAQGDALLGALDLARPLALVLGAEGRGLRKPVRAACDATARLPMSGPIASLNVSAAAAMALYEARRQRA